MGVVKKCNRKIDGVEMEYFIYGVDKIPYIMDERHLVDNLGAKKGDSVVMDRGKLYVYKPHRFEDLFDKIVFGGKEKDIPVGGIKDLSGNVGLCKSRKFPDDTIFEYFIYDKNSKYYPEWFPDVIKEYYLRHFNLKNGEYLVCVLGGKRDPGKNFSKEEFNGVFEITKLYVPCLYDCDDVFCVPVDASFVGDSIGHVGRKCKHVNNGTIYDFFIYGKDESPKWFDISKVNSNRKNVLKNVNKDFYVVNDFNDIEYEYRIFDKKDFYTWYLPFNDASSEYVSMNRDVQDDKHLNRAKFWFYNLPGRVMKYILNKYKGKDGNINIIEIYRKETGL